MEEVDQEQSGSDQLDEVEEEAADLDTGGDDAGDDEGDSGFGDEEGGDDI